MLYRLCIFLFIGFLTATTTHADNSCADTVKQWNDALHNKDIDIARALTSNTSRIYLRAHGEISGLSKKYVALDRKYVRNFGSAKILCEYEDPRLISNTKATVDYICTYPDGKRKIWRDTCYKEEGQWKVAPDKVRTRLLK